MRVPLLFAIAVLAASPASSAESGGGEWALKGRGPAERGWARFVRIYASPAIPDGWSIHVICGRVSTTSGNEILHYEGIGYAALTSEGTLVGTTSAPGKPVASWTVPKTGDGQHDQVVHGDRRLCR